MLEGYTSQDSSKLAQSFINELVQGFRVAREQMALILIQIRQILIDQNQTAGQAEGLLKYSDIILSRYLLSDGKIKGAKLRGKELLFLVRFLLSQNLLIETQES